MIKQFVHANIVVSNAERSVEFYTEVLGARVVREWIGESSTAGQGLGFGVGNLRYKGYLLRWGDGGPETFPILDLVEFLEPEPYGRPYEAMNHIGIARLCFEVDDMDATYEHLRSLGVRFLSPPVPVNPETRRGSITQLCSLYDPDGIVIELIGPFGD